MCRFDEVIRDPEDLLRGYTYRQGYMFAALKKSNVWDAVVIKNPSDCMNGRHGRYGVSERTLEEHIDFINRYQLESAIVYAEDISFLTRCPSLKHLHIYPADTAENEFDFSPLYDMPCINSLQCGTSYGSHQNECTAAVDYAKINGLVKLSIAGKGHLNYDRVNDLEEIFIANNKAHRDIGTVSCSEKMKKITLLQCGVETLHGIERFADLQALSVDHMRSLHDISQLKCAAGSLRALSVGHSPKIGDFRVLEELINLEHLALHGNNKLPNLDFLKKMKKLKTFSLSMEVQNGDLSPCLLIPCASVNRSYRHYNLKDKDLPKNYPTKPFEIN